MTQWRGWYREKYKWFTPNSLLLFHFHISTFLLFHIFYANKDFYSYFRWFHYPFYSDGKAGRQMSQCSVAIHSQDIETILAYFTPLYREIILIGHSLGCLAILGANIVWVKQVIFWEPSAGMQNPEIRGIVFEPKLDLYIAHRWRDFLFSKTLVQEMVEASELEKTSQKVSANTSFVFAWDYRIYPERKPFLWEFPYKVIEWASHTFCEEGKIAGLYDATWELLQGK